MPSSLKLFFFAFRVSYNWVESRLIISVFAMIAFTFSQSEYIFPAVRTFNFLRHLFNTLSQIPHQRNECILNYLLVVYHKDRRKVLVLTSRVFSFIFFKDLFNLLSFLVVSACKRTILCINTFIFLPHNSLL